MKKFAAFLLIVALLSSLVASAEVTKVTNAEWDSDGRMKLEWETSVKGAETTITYMYKTGDDYNKDKNAIGSTNILWSGAVTTGNKITIPGLAPETEYWVTLKQGGTTSFYNGIKTPYKGLFKGFDTTASVWPQRKVSDSDYRTLDQLSAENVLEQPGKYGIRLRMNYQGASGNKEYRMQVVITEPENGNRCVVQISNVKPAKGNGYVEWSHLNVDQFFEAMAETCGKAPGGKYKVTIYIDSYRAAETTFTVKGVSDLRKRAGAKSGGDEHCDVRVVTTKQTVSAKATAKPTAKVTPKPTKKATATPKPTKRATAKPTATPKPKVITDRDNTIYMKVGDTFKFKCNRHIASTYRWKVKEGEKLVSLSDSNDDTCTLKAKSAGKVVLYCEYTYYKWKNDPLTGISRNLPETDWIDFDIVISK